TGFRLRSLFFFFQAEDGIRDRNVTGVQTCALPISFDVFHYGKNFLNGITSTPSMSGMTLDSIRVVSDSVLIARVTIDRGASLGRSEEHTSELQVTFRSRMPSSA